MAGRHPINTGHIAWTGEMLAWLVERKIDPHIPVWDQSKVAADGKFTRADFTYDKDRDLYICPGSKELKTSGTVHDGTTIKYIAKRNLPTSSSLLKKVFEGCR